MDKFDFLSPLDYRYYNEKFAGYLSENARIKYQAQVEAALVKALAKQKACPYSVFAAVEKAAQKVSAREVYAEEAVTKHDIKALVNVLRKKVPKDARQFIHLGATSYDIVDTANAVRFKHATKELVLPALIALEKAWISIALKNKGTLQIGRTHGQHAVPLTFGFAMATFVDRLGNRIKEIVRAQENLCGKLSGAVGSYNASSLIVKDPRKLEASVMKILRLKVSGTSTQIVPPEPMQDLINALIGAFTVLANFADDMRHLQRTEIGEIAESFGEKQVGSSTMPHKRNP
ncbi:MAG: adenylosuccinate lyase, partial [Candidatus Diapherotrites archaeon]|nr:adenylosuccinate lyase [Candidatus Diapherotrites archaeon]